MRFPPSAPIFLGAFLLLVPLVFSPSVLSPSVMSPSAFGQSDNVSNPTKAADQDIREQLDCKFDGDLWIQSAKLPDGSDMMETWQRMKPDEDVSLRPSDIEP